MKKWICEKCIHSKKEIIKVKQSRYLKTIELRPNFYLIPLINGESLTFFCNKQMKYKKYICSCKDYQNTNLFSNFNKPNPQYLEVKPYSNTCTFCGGTGYVIIKQAWHEKSRFSREKCEICIGKGIIKKSLIF